MVVSHVNHLLQLDKLTPQPGTCCCCCCFKEKGCYLNIIRSMCNKWWMVWHFGVCLFVCSTKIHSTECAWMLGTRMRKTDRTLHVENREDAFSLDNKMLSPSLTFLTWALQHHSLQRHQFITEPYTSRENVSLQYFLSYYLHFLLPKYFFLRSFPWLLCIDTAQTHI